MIQSGVESGWIRLLSDQARSEMEQNIIDAAVERHYGETAESHSQQASFDVLQVYLFAQIGVVGIKCYQKKSSELSFSIFLAPTFSLALGRYPKKQFGHYIHITIIHMHWLLDTYGKCHILSINDIWEIFFQVTLGKTTPLRDSNSVLCSERSSIQCRKEKKKRRRAALSVPFASFIGWKLNCCSSVHSPITASYPPT